MAETQLKLSGKHRVCAKVYVCQGFWLFPCRQHWLYLSLSLFPSLLSPPACRWCLDVFFLLSYIFLHMLSSVQGVSFVFDWSISYSVPFSLLRTTAVISHFQEIVAAKPIVLWFLFNAVLHSNGKCSVAKISSLGFRNTQGKHTLGITALICSADMWEIN